MGTRIYIFAIIIGLGFLVFIIRYIKSQSLSPSYSAMWIAVALFLLSISIFEPVYRWFAYTVVGIIDARHIIYIVLIGFLLVNNLFLTSKITRMAGQIQMLITFTSILEKRLNDHVKK
jgi:hypothetical protein